ncbi:hypothetical protein IFVP136_C230797 [Vibrio parahaemolyticus]
MFVFPAFGCIQTVLNAKRLHDFEMYLSIFVESVSILCWHILLT